MAGCGRVEVPAKTLLQRSRGDACVPFRCVRIQPCFGHFEHCRRECRFDSGTGEWRLCRVQRRAPSTEVLSEVAHISTVSDGVQSSIAVRIVRPGRGACTCSKRREGVRAGRSAPSGDAYLDRRTMNPGEAPPGGAGCTANPWGRRAVAECGSTRRRRASASVTGAGGRSGRPCTIGGEPCVTVPPQVRKGALCKCNVTYGICRDWVA